MRRLARTIVALSAAAALVVPALAEASTIEIPTSITANRKPTGAVEPGTSVHIYGKLSSPKARCERNSTIKLIKVGKGVIRTTTTGRRGRYAFDIRVWNTAHYRVRFPGKTLKVVHPDTYVCAASRTSLRILVR